MLSHWYPSQLNTRIVYDNQVLESMPGYPRYFSCPDFDAEYEGRSGAPPVGYVELRFRVKQVSKPQQTLVKLSTPLHSRPDAICKFGVNTKRSYLFEFIDYPFNRDRHRDKEHIDQSFEQWKSQLGNLIGPDTVVENRMSTQNGFFIELPGWKSRKLDTRYNFNFKDSKDETLYMLWRTDL